MQELIDRLLRACIDDAVLRRAQNLDDHIEIAVDDDALGIERFEHLILAAVLHGVHLLDGVVHLRKQCDVSRRKELLHRPVEADELREKLGDFLACLFFHYSSTPFSFRSSRALSTLSLPVLFLIGANSCSRTISNGRHVPA